MEKNLRHVFQVLMRGEHLSRDQARWLFSRIMSGQVSESVIGALLGALCVRGESIDELVGAAEAMREGAIKVACSADCIDTCGTGGDGISTFNVSTTAAIIAAAAGAIVAKHGNRSATRVSGSSEVLTELGIDVDAEPGRVERSLREARIGYLNARMLHPAMRYAAPVREALPVRTIFNLLGPLTNPAGARRQLLGVPRPDLVGKIAESLRRLGAVHAWVVHGDDGLCDLTITGPATVAEVCDGAIRRIRVSPADVGLSIAPRESLHVASPRDSADAICSILAGVPGPRRDHALLNAGAALVVAGVAPDLRSGVELAAASVDSGEAERTLARWRTYCGR